MERYTTTEQINLEIAKERVKRMKKFYNHLFIFVIGVAFYVAKTYFGAPLNFFPIRYLNETFMWCWTFIVAIQGIKLFFIENVLGNNWEKRQIEEIMRKENIEEKKWK